MGDTKKNIDLVGVSEVIFEGMFPAGTGASADATGGTGSEFEGQMFKKAKGDKYKAGAAGAAKSKAAAGFKTKAKTGGPVVVPGKGKGGR